MEFARRAALVLAVVALGCAPPSPSEPPNVLLIVVDTLRADRLGAYGSVRRLTPFLDGLASRGIVFQRAYASSCWTNPSLFTSRSAWQHGVTLLTPVSSDEVTLAEALAERGYDTAGYSANFLVSEALGYAQGFRVYATPQSRKVAGVERPVPLRAEALNQMVVDWWHDRRSRDARGPAFVYLQYMEPHWPYAPPAEILERRFGGKGRPDVDAANGAYFLANGLPVDDPRVQDLKPLYDAEVLALDTGLARLFQALEREKFLDNAVVVVTADHGEAFWDHGRVGHGGTLFDELIHVPLLVLVPGNQTRVDVGEVVSLVDVAPTVLDLAELARPTSFEGHSLRALMAAPSWRNLFGLVRGEWPSKDVGR